jgi:hypothetical protein
MKKIILFVTIICANYGFCEAKSFSVIGSGVKYHADEKTARKLALQEAHEDLERRASRDCRDMHYADRVSGFSSKVVSGYAHFGEFEAKAEVGAEFECSPVCGPQGCGDW